MVSKTCRLLLVTLVVIAMVGSGLGCKPAHKHVNSQQVDEWYCPPNQVMFMVEKVYRCFDTSPTCPNGAIFREKCHCFPGTRRERNGACGKMCSNCDNGWCSSPSKCECNDGFTMNYGRCLPSWEQPFSHQMPSQVLVPQPPWDHHRHHHFHHPPPQHFGVPPIVLPPPPMPFYPQGPPQGFLATHPQQQPGLRPQPRPEFPSQALPQSPQVAPPQLQPTNRPEMRPVNPKTPLPFGIHKEHSSELQPESFAESHTESPPHRAPNLLPVGRPYPFGDDEAPKQPSSQGQPETSRCISDYNWDPESRTCIWNKAGKEPQLDLRVV